MKSRLGIGLGIGLLTVAMAGWIAGCSSATEDKTKAADVTPPASTEPVELVIYTNNGASEKVFDDSYGTALRAAFPQYTIKYIQSAKGTTLSELISAGTRIDIFWATIGNYETAMFEYNLQFDMTDLIKKHAVDLTKLEPTVIAAMKQVSGGKMYGIPVVTSNMNLFYNQAIFDKFGVAYPKAGINWEETNELAKKLTRMDSGKQYYGISTSPDHIIRMNPLSIPNADLKTAKPTILTDERWKRLFETVFVQPMQDPGYRDGMRALKNLPGLNQFAKDQSLAMYTYLNTLPTSVPNELKTMKWDILPLPVFKESPGVGTQSYPVYFGLTSQAKNKDAGMEVLKYMVSEPYQKYLSGKGLIPILTTDSVKKHLGQDTDFKDKNYQAFLQYKFAPITEKASAYDTEVVRAYRENIIPLALGDMDINTVFRMAADKAEKAIEESKKK